MSNNAIKEVWIVGEISPVAYDNKIAAWKHAEAEHTADGYNLPITHLVIKSSYEPNKVK